MVEKLRTEFERRFSAIEHSPMHAEATLLDPRFKDKGFFSKSAAERVVTQLRLKVGSYRIPQENVLPQDPLTSVPSTSTSTSIWAEFDQEVAKLTPTNPTAAGIVEMEKYLQEPL